MKLRNFSDIPRNFTNLFLTVPISYHLKIPVQNYLLIRTNKNTFLSSKFEKYSRDFYKNMNDLHESRVLVL